MAPQNVKCTGHTHLGIQTQSVGCAELKNFEITVLKLFKNMSSRNIINLARDFKIMIYILPLKGVLNVAPISENHIKDCRFF